MAIQWTLIFHQQDYWTEVFYAMHIRGGRFGKKMV
jgi:hypothetical protein